MRCDTKHDRDDHMSRRRRRRHRCSHTSREHGRADGRSEQAPSASAARLAPRASTHRRTEAPKQAESTPHRPYVHAPNPTEQTKYERATARPPALARRSTYVRDTSPRAATPRPGVPRAPPNQLDQLNQPTQSTQPTQENTEATKATEATEAPTDKLCKAPRSVGRSFVRP